MWRRTEVGVIRYVENLIIYGMLTKEQLQGIYKRLESFLLGRGLQTVDVNRKSFVFKPGVSFELLGYKFIYPNCYNSKLLNQGRYTKIRHPSYQVVDNIFVKWARLSIYVIVCSTSFKRISRSFKDCLHSKHYYWSVGRMIERLNGLI